MGEELPEVGVDALSKPISRGTLGRNHRRSILELTGAVLRSMGIIRRVAAVEGAVWVVVLVIPHPD